MQRLQRPYLVGFSAILLAWLSWIGGSAALAQVQVQVQAAQFQLQPLPFPGPDGGPTPTPNPKDRGTAAQFSAVKLIEEPKFRQFIQVARDCIKDKAWNDAVEAIQTILDEKADSYVQLREKNAAGQDVLRWASVKFEANNLLSSMPAEGLDLYELRYGGKAKSLLDDAKAAGDLSSLAEVAARFLHTQAGAEANDLLATSLLDRGQFFLAALRFEKMGTLNPERHKISELTLFKTVLAYKRAGDTKKADDAWKKLESQLGDRRAIKLGEQFVSLDVLTRVLDDQPRIAALDPSDWPLIRGNNAHVAQAIGSPPLLDMELWRRQLLLDKDDETGQVDKLVQDHEGPAKGRIDTTISQVQSLNNVPVLSGMFPIVANKYVVVRSYGDVRAYRLYDEKDGDQVMKAGTLAWRSVDMEGGLTSILDNPKIRPNLDQWLAQYQAVPGFLSFLYENTTIGAISSDHRNVYGVDDLAIPAPANMFQQFAFNNGMPNVLSQDLKPLVMQNSLYAIDIATGALKWTLGDIRKKDGPFADSHFLGAPVSVGGKLYVLNEKNPGFAGDAELRLVCIDPNKIQNGQPTVVEPILTLGTVQTQSRFTHDSSRRTNAAFLGYAEGILVCPTNAGEVLGIDLLNRTLAWSYPYREQAPQQQIMGGPIFRPVPRPQPNFTSSPNATWKSAPPALVNGKVVFTAPDASSVHCINLRDGIPVWKQKQMDGDLFFAGVVDGKALIVGRNMVRALNIENGRQAWAVSTGDLPAGQGVASKNIYYLPLKKGEVLAIDVERGFVKAHNRAKTQNVPLGNLVFSEGAVFSATPTQLAAFPQLAVRLDVANKDLAKDANNPEKLVNRGELLLADGQVQGAVDDLRAALAQNIADPLQARAKNRLYDALTDLLQIDFDKAAKKYLAEYRELCNLGTDDDDKQTKLARYFRIVGQGREQQGDLVEAFTMYREFGSLPIHRKNGGIVSPEDPSHKVPTNVWLRGRVSSMMSRATPQQRDPLERKIAEEWKIVEAKKDPDAIRAFVGMFDVPFVVGREARLRLAESLIEKNDLSSFLEAELNLLQLRNLDLRHEAASGGRSLAMLAMLEEKKRSAEAMKEAAAYYRELARDFPAAQVRGSGENARTGSDLFDELAADKRFIPYLEESSTLWSQAKMNSRDITSGSPMTGSAASFQFRLDGDLSPSIKRHRLVLEPVNNSPVIRFVNAATGQSRWSLSLGAIPNFHYFNHLYHQQPFNRQVNAEGRYRVCQIVGHVGVVQVGTNVYALDLEAGKVLWQKALIDLPANPQMNNGMFLQQFLTDQEGNVVMVMINQFNGQPTRTLIGHIGAVAPSYVALITAKGLHVVDPLRGATVYTKADIGPENRCFGDDQYLFLIEGSDAGSVGAGRTLRANDGEQLNVPDYSTVYQQKIRIMGRRILAAGPGQGGQMLRLYDIPSGKDVWSRKFDARAIALQTEDEDLAGMIEPDGKMTVVHVETGKELMSSSVIQGRVDADYLKTVKDPLLLADSDRFYVALNHPLDANKVPGGMLANNFTNGLASRTVNGWFMAFHRLDGERKSGERTSQWKRGELAWMLHKPVENQMVVVDQFDLLPVVVFTSRRNETLGGVNGMVGNRWVSNTEAYQKSNGKTVYFQTAPRQSNGAPQFHSFAIDAKGGAINLLGFTGSVQIYVDDGRKVELPSGTQTGMTGQPDPNIGVVPVPGMIQPGIIVRPPIIRRAVPPIPVPDNR